MRDALEFEWDDGNRGKNFQKHGITDAESEESFFDPAKKILEDRLHSDKEKRYILLGKAKSGKMLFIVFTIRKEKIRIISSRPLNRKEKRLYEKEA